MYEKALGLEEADYDLDEMIEAAENIEELEAKEIVHPIPFISTDIGKKPLPADLWDPHHSKRRFGQKREDDMYKSGDDAARELEWLKEHHDIDVISADYLEDQEDYELKLGFGLYGVYREIVYETPSDESSTEVTLLESLTEYNSLRSYLPNRRSHQ